MAAFDSGNLPAVAKALREKHPDKPVVMAGDDDQYQRQTQGTNPGRTQAEAAAKAVGGKAIFPIFPRDQQAAQKFTDFNDLATKSDYGRSRLVRPVRPVVDQEIQRLQVRQGIEREARQPAQTRRSAPPIDSSARRPSLMSPRDGPGGYWAIVIAPHREQRQDQRHWARYCQ